jgi:hypothetical protein
MSIDRHPSMGELSFIPGLGRMVAYDWLDAYFVDDYAKMLEISKRMFEKIGI